LLWIWKRKKKEKYVLLSSNKQLLSSLLGINRKRIYYQGKMEAKDNLVRQEINQVHLIHPAYGHKRLALALGYGRNKILRIMRKFGIRPPRRKVKGKWLTVSTDNHNYTNLIKNIVPVRPGQIFVSDLTYLKHQNKEFYLATVEDIFTREVVSAEVSDKHDSLLAFSVIRKAIDKNRPEIFHSDQGTEFMAQMVTSYLEKQNIKISVSEKASPWQNGYKESFFGRFKEENGDLNRFDTLGELIEEIYSYVYYYNHLRIHTSLKMPPVQFKQKYLESLSRKMGT
jgi:transposase InsO family protein